MVKLSKEFVENSVAQAIFRNPHTGELKSLNSSINTEHEWIDPSFVDFVFSLLEKLLESGVDQTLLAQFWQLLEYGILENSEIPTGLPGRNIDQKNLRKRILELYVKYPELLQFIVDQETYFIHFTGSASLSSILKQGLVGQEDQLEPVPNGLRDSNTSKKRVSLDQWHSDSFQFYLSLPTNESSEHNFISPLTKENIEDAISYYRQEADMHRRVFDKDNKGIYPPGSLRFDLKVKIYEAFLETYDTMLNSLQSDSVRQAFIENLPIVLMVKTPEEWVIPRGDWKTEVMTEKVPIEDIKGILVPHKHIDLVRALLQEHDVAQQISIFELERFCSF